MSVIAAELQSAGDPERKQKYRADDFKHQSNGEADDLKRE